MSNTNGSLQAFCLKLNSHQSHLIDSFQKLYHDQTMVDCTLSCAGGSLKAHKIVLSACSPYFAQLFSGFTNPYQYPVIILKDMPFVDLKAIVEFMYKGEVTVPQASLPSILEAAKNLLITGLCDIKIANQQDAGAKTQETEKKQSTVGGRTRGRKRRRAMADKSGGDTGDGETAESEHSDFGENSESEEKAATGGKEMEVVAAAPSGGGGGDTLDEQLEEGLDELSEGGMDNSQSSSGLNTGSVSVTSTPGVQRSTGGGARMTPSAAMKANLRATRIEKLQATTGGVSAGRKMWSEEETRALVKVWEEESARVWASAGKKVLSLKRISDLLMMEKIDRDVSQVEGKIKALKRDYKAVKADRAIPAVQARMAPYLDKLDQVFSREEL